MIYSSLALTLGDGFLENITETNRMIYIEALTVF